MIVKHDPHGVVDLFRDMRALLSGNFRMTGGLHSPVFFQKSLVFQYPQTTAWLCRKLADLAVQNYERVDCVISIATGGIIPGYETAKALCVPAMYLEREQGELTLRRGFSVPTHWQALLVDDVVTTGLSLREAVRALDSLGVRLAGAVCLIDRSGGVDATLPVTLRALARVEVPVYAESELPPEMAALPVQEPGSRRLS